MRVEGPPPGSDPDALYDLTPEEQRLLEGPPRGFVPAVKAVQEHRRWGLADALRLVRAWEHLRRAMTWTEVQVAADLDNVAEGLLHTAHTLRVWRLHQLDSRHTSEDLRGLREIATTLIGQAQRIRVVADAIQKASP